MTVSDTIERVARECCEYLDRGEHSEFRSGKFEHETRLALTALRPGDELPNGLDVQQGWQSIETAPKDGDMVLVAILAGRVLPAVWDRHESKWVGWLDPIGFADIVPPKLWRPLPDARALLSASRPEGEQG